MARVSKRVLDQSTLSEITGQFMYLLGSLKEEQEIRNFLDGFLTREEKVMLAKRLAVFLMLRRGYSSAAIQQALTVSYETVRSYSVQLSLLNESFGKTIDRLVSWERTKEFWKKVDKVLKPLDVLMSSKGNMRARAKLYNADYDWH